MNRGFQLDCDLWKKYNVAGPRYTSYPTAPQFKEWSAVEWEEILTQSVRENTADASLYFHIPFCPTLCLFCGCNVVITRKQDEIGRYIDRIIKEMDLFIEKTAFSRKVVQMHWGGGSPSYLEPYDIHRLSEAIRSRFSFSSEPELSVELDPRRLREEHIEAFAREGFNRISLGVQDFARPVQEAINRRQSEEETRQAIEWCRAMGMKSLNIDLIYGLPKQTVSGFMETIDKVLELSPDRLAVYNFAYVPWLKVHQRGIKEETLPSPEEKLRMLVRMIERLTAGGYVYIGMDHFAKPEDELAVAQREGTLQRNFQGYSTKRDTELFGFGITAISCLSRLYGQNVKETELYESMIERGSLPGRAGILLNQDDIIRRHIIMELMCNLKLDFYSVEKRFDISFADYFSTTLSELESFIKDGLIVMDTGGLRVTDQGRFFIRNIAMVFDAYLDRSSARYSKTV